MEIKFKHNNDNEKGGSKNRFFVFAGVLVAVVVIGAGVTLWLQFRSAFGIPELKAFRAYQMEVEDAYKADIYGGATPEETLQLFVDALKAEDIELASKYFALDQSLSRDRWVVFLNEIKERGLLQTMASDINERALPAGSSYEGNYAFEIYNDDGTVAVTIEMELNPHTKVWKIESL